MSRSLRGAPRRCGDAATAAPPPRATARRTRTSPGPAAATRPSRAANRPSPARARPPRRRPRRAEIDGINRCACGADDSGGRASATRHLLELRANRRRRRGRSRPAPAQRRPRARAPVARHRPAPPPACRTPRPPSHRPETGYDRRAARVGAQRQQQRRPRLARNEPRRVARPRHAPRRHLARQTRRHHQRIDADEKARRPLLRRQPLLRERQRLRQRVATGGDAPGCPWDRSPGRRRRAAAATASARRARTSPAPVRRRSPGSGGCPEPVGDTLLQRHQRENAQPIDPAHVVANRRRRPDDRPPVSPDHRQRPDVPRVGVDRRHRQRQVLPHRRDRPHGLDRNRPHDGRGIGDGQEAVAWSWPALAGAHHARLASVSRASESPAADQRQAFAVGHRAEPPGCSVASALCRSRGSDPVDPPHQDAGGSERDRRPVASGQGCNRELLPYHARSSHRCNRQTMPCSSTRPATPSRHPRRPSRRPTPPPRCPNVARS